MKTYFERLSKIGKEAVVGLRQLDAQHAEMHKSYHELLTKGEITPAGYERYIKDLEKIREKYIRDYDSQLETLKEEYAKAVDEYTTPSVMRMHDDATLLKDFDLSATEFERLAEKHGSNPTMCRLLDKYRVEHGIETNWRCQSAKERKDIFNSACNSVYFIMNQSDKYSFAREATIDYNTAKAYHSLQGSVTDIMPIPANPSPNPGSTIINDGSVAVVGGTGDIGTVF